MNREIGTEDDGDMRAEATGRADAPRTPTACVEERPSHTPGPWTQQVVRTDCGVVFKIGPLSLTRGKYEHACIYTDYPGSAEYARASANAHLMAAAPVLLASAVAMEHGYRMRCNYCNGNVSVCDACPPGGCQAPAVRAVIAAAAPAQSPPPLSSDGGTRAALAPSEETSCGAGAHPNAGGGEEKRMAHIAAWQPIETAPLIGGKEVLLRVKMRAGIRGGMLVGHYMGGGHCIEDHPPIAAGWYFWNGCMFDKAAEPTHWMPLPAPPSPNRAATATSSQPQS